MERIMEDNNLYKKACQFAIRIVNAHKHLSKEKIDEKIFDDVYAQADELSKITFPY